jgi:hypothetical protein
MFQPHEKIQALLQSQFPKGLGLVSRERLSEKGNRTQIYPGCDKSVPRLEFGHLVTEEHEMAEVRLETLSIHSQICVLERSDVVHEDVLNWTALHLDD